MLVMCTGLPGSGKTTWAREMVNYNPHQTIRVNKDDLRTMLFGSSVWTRAQETVVVKVRDAIICEALEQGKRVIVDDTNFGPHAVNLKKLAARAGVEFRVKDFTHIPLEDCIANDATRDNPVGREVIERMYKTWIERTAYDN